MNMVFLVIKILVFYVGFIRTVQCFILRAIYRYVPPGSPFFIKAKKYSA
jgi:hypothetical protein